jgi:uncharacterized Tic20 family protein
LTTDAFLALLKPAEELARLSLLNWQISVVYANFIALVLVLTGLLCLMLPETALLLPTALAKAVMTGLVVFWAARLFRAVVRRRQAAVARVRKSKLRLTS